MTLLEVLQLTGYSLGSALHLWMGALLTGQRTSLDRIERVLLWLTFTIGVWHASNLLLFLRELLGLSAAGWHTPLRVVETLAVVSITLSYSLLLHAHLHLWANARRRLLTRIERFRVLLSYVPLVFLPFAIHALWVASSGDLFERLARVRVLGVEWDFVLAFAFWAAYVLALVGGTDLLVARLTDERRERLFMSTLALSFYAIATLILLVHGFRLGAGTTAGAYLQTLANLGSLLPTALLVYHIYRYRYLELVIKNSVVVALFAVAVLVTYLYGIRLLGDFLTSRFDLRPGVVESLLILCLALAAAPMRGWLEREFARLFSRETSLYREVLARIGLIARESWRYKQLPELLEFVAARTAATLGMHRIEFALRRSGDSDEQEEMETEESDNAEAGSVRSHGSGELSELFDDLKAADFIEDVASLRAGSWRAALALRGESELYGAMLVDAPAERLTPEIRQALGVIAAQVGIAIAECRLVEENVRLERRLAEGERLAELGRMAATVAHEVKNPLSAIKSIAQVMREDETIAAGYSRDLELIVGETDRLSRSVTQLLDWTRRPALAGMTCDADELIRSVIRLFSHEAHRREIDITLRSSAPDVRLDPVRAAALRDAFSNLLLNAIQATPPRGRIEILTSRAGDALDLSITDGGTGVPAELRGRIWEPFFTTKQRGTGLGLAIVRKRIEAVGGRAALVPMPRGAGARFDLRLPLRHDETTAV